MWWIKQSVTRALANKASTIRVPIHAAEQERAVHGARNHLQAIIGREPSVEELSEYVGKSPEEIRGSLNFRKSVVSYDIPVGSGDEGTLSDLLPGEAEADAEELLGENALQDHVRDLDILPERERYVVEQRYGLEGDGSATLEEIGADIGVTRERVRQIQTSALRRLRAYALKAELGSLLDPCYSPAS
jgi:RNA polymerase sigma factor (sigma-70 family)